MIQFESPFADQEIIWVGNNSLLSEEAIPTSAFKYYASIDDFDLSSISNLEVSCVVFYFNTSFDPAYFYSVLKQAKIENVKWQKILIVDQKILIKFPDLIRSSINTGAIDFIVNLPEDRAALSQIFIEAKNRFSSRVNQNELFKKSQIRVKELEELTESLEKIVEERTFGIAESKREEEDKLRREREIIRFIKEMSLCQTVDDILIYFRNELKKFHGVNEIILLQKVSQDRLDVFYFSNRQICRLESSHNFLSNRISEQRDWSSFFANEFKRPFGRCDFVDIPTDYEPSQFLFETSISGEAKKIFLDFLNDRILVTGLVLDRIFLEEKTRKYSSRWEKTFDNISNSIAIIDRNYRVSRSNKMFLKGEARSKPSEGTFCYQVFANRESPCENCCLLTSLSEKTTHSVQILVDNKIFQMICNPIRHHEDIDLSYAINQYIDITKSRELYLKMLQSEKISSIGLLAGNIAHELNNPLTGIRSLVQVLKKTMVLNSQQISDLEEIEKATVRCQKIIINLLDFSTNSGGPRQKVSFDDLIARTLPMLKSATRFFRTEVSLCTEGAKVLAEPNMIQQVIFNVVNNACQAMVGKGEIRISTHVVDQNWVELIISDTGKGIPPEIQNRIFEPFFSSKKETVGTGLGLSMSKEVLTRHGGSISFRSKVDIGTDFFIRLPIIEEEN